MPNIEIYNEDCILGMKRFPDKHFDLAIVDPPYGINADKHAHKNGENCGHLNFKKHRQTDWDNATPNKEYFDELFRVSKNQIVWGANYFTPFLPPSMGWIFWYKMQDNFSFSDGELAFSSFDCKTRIFKYRRNREGFGKDKVAYSNTHPTQKPEALYRFCLDKFAKPGNKILDTHLGGGGICIACDDYGYDLTAFEIDEYYYNQAKARLENHRKQLKLFETYPQVNK